MAETSTCHIEADMYEGENEVCVYFRFEHTEDAERFLELFGKAVEEGTIRVGSVKFPPAKIVREAK